MDDIYRKVPQENIPWNSDSPPELLVRLVESGKITPCRTIDLGCGTGNYAIWLASKGFDVTGVDLAPTAIGIARENAVAKGEQCHFIVADVLGDLSEVEGMFSFAFDWELLHHIFPEDREKYVENVYRLLNPGGKYLSVCFNEDDPQFGGQGKYRKTRLGTELYFSSVEELKKLFEPHFKIFEIKATAICGRFGPHVVNYAFMEK
jgi:SAM-dependent methyltransferase